MGRQAPQRDPRVAHLLWLFITSVRKQGWFSGGPLVDENAGCLSKRGKTSFLTILLGSLAGAP